ncbi:MAG: hypothetical protein B6I20_04265 [Bacteroidetes bacterium 4572_117]|nr:MAG: hypothetical protein B6I20_04265 [Bacteroidetes bacterium 4572_117]
MEKKNYTILVIDDLLPENDPIIIELKEIYNEVVIRKEPNTGVSYVKANHKNKQIIVVCDYLFGSKYKPNGKWILQNIRKYSDKIPFVLLTAVENQITDYKDFIKLKIFDIANMSDYFDVINIVKEAEQKYIQQKDDVLAEMQSIINQNKKRTKVSKSKHISFFVDKIKEIPDKDLQNHFTEIKIEEYKVLSGIKLENINKINLIAGLNNSGKTTLLEAIFLLTKQNEFDEFLEIQRIRGKFNEIFDIPNIFLKNHTSNKINIGGIFKNIKTKLEYEKKKQVAEIEAQNHICSYLINSYVETDKINETPEENLETKVHLYGDKFNYTDSNIISYTQRNLCLSEFYSPFAFQQREKLKEAYTASVKTKIGDKITHDKIIDFLKNKIDKNIIDIKLIIEDNDIRFIVNHKSFETTKDLTEFGDGLQRMYAIALQFAAVQNGILLIDELENAIDYKRLSDFAGLIIELAVEFNVQVFITSHSKECINAFISKEKAHLISTYSLINKNSEIMCKHFKGVVYNDLINSVDADLRKVTK